MRTFAPLLLTSLLLTTCCSDPPAQGGEGQRCYPNDTCNEGLLCVDGTCEGGGEDCGDGVCNGEETATTCPEDCEVSAICGDGLIEDAEACDGTNLDGQSCATLGLGNPSGTLGCLADCSDYDVSDCTSCGDDIIQIPEVCDASNLGGLTCRDVGFLSGELACSADCLTHDTSGCTNTCEEADCPTCIGSACALAACEDERLACEANLDCGSLSGCFAGCADITCQDACYQQFPAGLEDFMNLRNCLFCDPDVCLDECPGVTACP